MRGRVAGQAPDVECGHICIQVRGLAHSLNSLSRQRFGIGIWIAMGHQVIAEEFNARGTYGHA